MFDGSAMLRKQSADGWRRSRRTKPFSFEVTQELPFSEVCMGNSDNREARKAAALSRGRKQLLEGVDSKVKFGDRESKAGVS